MTEAPMSDSEAGAVDFMYLLDRLEEAGIVKTHLDVFLTNDLANDYWTKAGWTPAVLARVMRMPSSSHKWAASVSRS